MSRLRLCALALGAALALGVAPAPEGPCAAAPRTSDLDRLVGMMTGAFSSAAQAARDTAFLDIRLHMAPVWPGRPDGRWLYVEQARGDRLDRPYRQRVYRVRALPDGAFESAVYALPAPLRFAGAWREPARLDALAPDSLLAREGCAVILRRDGDRFVGATRARDCPSELRGAAYATSEVTIGPDGMRTLDRGYDSTGVQVWGSTRGAYVFLRER